MFCSHELKKKTKLFGGECKSNSSGNKRLFNDTSEGREEAMVELVRHNCLLWSSSSPFCLINPNPGDLL